MNTTLNILVVDDDSEFCVPMIAALIDDGHQVWRARSGVEAVQIAVTLRMGFDMVICAMYFTPTPNPSSGLDVMEVYRRDYPSTRFVLMDGHSPSLTRAFADEAKADGFLEKERSVGGRLPANFLRDINKLLQGLFP